MTQKLTSEYFHLRAGFEKFQLDPDSDPDYKLLIGTGDRIKRDDILNSLEEGGLQHLFDGDAADHAAGWLFHTLHELFSRSHVAAKQHPDWSTYEGFWQRFASEFVLDVATTNYDDLVEQAIPDIRQGFAQIPGETVWRFDPKLLKEEHSRLMHLHGSIHFGYRPLNTNVNRFAYEDEFEDVHWHSDPTSARDSWGARSNHIAQSGEETIVGALITGMQKANKLVASEPYLTYYRRFGEFIQETPRLLIPSAPARL